MLRSHPGQVIPGRTTFHANARTAPTRAWLLCIALVVSAVSCTSWRPADATRRDVAPHFVFYPPPPEEPRIQYLATYASEEDVVGAQSRFRRFIFGKRRYAEIGKPYGVAIYRGQIFVCDTRAGVVVILDLVDRSTRALGSRQPGRLVKPINIALDEDGTRYVADPDLARIMVYDRADNFLRALGAEDGWSPSDLVISDDRLYVTDVRNGQVVVLDKTTGRVLDRLSRRGSGEGELFFPTNIEQDGDGNLYVTDTGNFRVLKFDREGRFLRQFGSLGRALGRFVRPKGVAVDHEGRVYVVDSAFENVQIFDAEGRLLLFFGNAVAGHAGLSVPAKVEIDYGNVDLYSDRVAPGYRAEYLILVSSQFGPNKINVYGFLRRSGDAEGQQALRLPLVSSRSERRS